MEYTRQVATLQAATLIVSTIFGIGVQPIPLFAVRSADKGAPLAAFLAILIAYPFVATLRKKRGTPLEASKPNP